MAKQGKQSRTNQERFKTLEMASNPPQVSGYLWRQELQKVINLCNESLRLTAQAQRSNGDTRTHIEGAVIEKQSEAINLLHQLREYRE